ncbi:hypothetical protein SDC9_210789 [bioreactor metagenome]|uniref:Uncharacterized protein n=1 Tax=bioreactor metagenome TaxID=1076179 RepID=A0A645JH69_9ZZZZ
MVQIHPDKHITRIHFTVDRLAPALFHVGNLAGRDAHLVNRNRIFELQLADNRVAHLALLIGEHLQRKPLSLLAMIFHNSNLLQIALLSQKQQP